MRIFRRQKRYELVRTRKQQKEFEKTWEYFCKKYRWVNDPYAPDGVRYNLIVPGGHFFQRRKVIGTIEFIPYDPNNPNSTVEGRGGISFNEQEEVRKYPNRVWEIDKLCLHRDYQRQGYFRFFLPIVLEHIRTYNTKYYLGFMEGKFYRMLRIWHGVKVLPVGHPVQGPKSSLVPVIVDAEYILYSKDQLKNFGM